MSLGIAFRTSLWSYVEKTSFRIHRKLSPLFTLRLTILQHDVVKLKEGRKACHCASILCIHYPGHSSFTIHRATESLPGFKQGTGFWGNELKEPEVLFPRKKTTSIDIIKHDESSYTEWSHFWLYRRKQAEVVVLFSGRREHAQRTEIYLASGKLSKIKGGELV